MTAVPAYTGDFKNLYRQLREKEGRVYSDDEVLRLPSIHRHHPYYHEWQMRKRSSQRLVYYLRQKAAPLFILEVGCGNGWLSHRLASVPGSQVTGADINNSELQQAVRVFNQVPNLRFIYGDMSSDVFTDVRFDIVVFAACIQYFPSLTGIIRHSMERLKLNGEIHILDSPFYKPGEISMAQERSKAYFSNLGYPEMHNYYFHHAITTLDAFNYTTLYRPTTLQHYLLQNKNPFPWICIKKNEA